jgi:predicted RNA-binding protein YlqC (UPF0109 family)
MSSASEILENIIKLIVSEPNQVQISEDIGNNTISINIKAAPKDVGKIIGREGKTARALRTIANVVGSKDEKKVNVVVLD